MCVRFSHSFEPTLLLRESGLWWWHVGPLKMGNIKQSGGHPPAKSRFKTTAPRHKWGTKKTFLKVIPFVVVIIYNYKRYFLFKINIIRRIINE